MNLVVLHGRLTRDIEVKYTSAAEPMAVARTGVAVNREGKPREGQPNADFINLVAFGKTAEFMEKYFAKGSAIIVTGRLTTGSYKNKEGATVYTTDVNVEKVEFAGDKKAEGGTSAPSKPTKPTAPTNDELDDSLPF